MRTTEKDKRYEAWPGWLGSKKKRLSKTAEEKNVSETKSEYVDRQRKNIKIWTSEIDRYQVQAEKLAPKNSEKFKKHIVELKVKHSQLEAAMEDIHKSGEAGWEDLKSGSEKLFKALDKSFKSAKEYFH
jgi:hypothetical protein